MVRAMAMVVIVVIWISIHRVASFDDVRDLGGGETDDFEARVVTKARIEIMEVATCGTQNQNALFRRYLMLTHHTSVLIPVFWA